jgi:Tol biopolymer transport system component
MFLQKSFVLTIIISTLLFVSSGCEKLSFQETPVPVPFTERSLPPTVTQATSVQTAPVISVTLSSPTASLTPWQAIKTSGVIQLTNCDPQCLDPAWLPDGAGISYFSGGDGQIHIIDLQGKTIRRFALPPGGSSPTWSPDGKWMVFSRSGDKENELAVMSVDGNTSTTIFSSVAQLYNPVWSFDSQSIYCVLEETRRSSKIIKLDLDGSKAEQIAVFPGNVTGLSLSSDGKMVAYVTLTSDGRAESLRLLEIGKSKSRVLFDRAVSTPVWSPDGRRIAFGADFPDSEIYVINIDGTGLIKITNHPGYADRDANWSPDGSCLVFAANSVTSTGLYSADDQVYMTCPLEL